MKLLGARMRAERPLRTWLTTSKSALLIGAILFATGCSGGGGTSTIAALPNGSQANSGQTSTAGSAQAKFAIAIPAKTTQGLSRKPEYISASTQSITILTDGAAPQTFNLTPSSPNCTTGSGGSTNCVETVSAPTGVHTFTLTLFDRLGGAGNALSTNNVPNITVTAPSIVVPVVLQGIVAKVLLALSNPAPSSGVSTTIDLTPLLEDADGNIIIGPAVFNNPVTLTDSDNSGATPLSKTLLNSPADAFGITIAYNGSPISSATFSATASGLSAANVTPAILKPKTPQAVSATGSGALATLAVKGSIIAFVPTALYGGPGLIPVPVINSTGILSELRAPRALSRTLAAKTVRKLESTNAVIPNTSDVTACSGDQVNLKLYCVSAFSSRVTVVDASTVPATVSSSYTIDAATTINFSGGTCIVCGVVYDATNKGILLATFNGFELYDNATQKLVKTIPADVAENFGYNGVTNQIFNANYPGNSTYGISGIDLIDVAAATRYTLAPRPANLDEPDQSAVDNSTNIGISSEEYSGGNAETVYLLPLGNATLNSSTGTFSLPNPVVSTLTSSIFSTCDLTADGISVDSTTHTAFFFAEYCSPGTFGTALLPSTATSTPTLSNAVFAVFPNTPDGNVFSSPHDPHALATTSSPLGDFGVTFNLNYTYAAVIDFKKLAAAPRMASDSTVVDPSYDLIGNGVVHYIQI